jgi:hypothetical protein
MSLLLHRGLSVSGMYVCIEVNTSYNLSESGVKSSVAFYDIQLMLYHFAYLLEVTYLKIISKRKKLLYLRHRVLFSIPNYFEI